MLILIVHFQTSGEGNHGHIRYSVEVVLDIPYWPDKEFEELFTVIKPLDLNDEYKLRVSDHIDLLKISHQLRTIANDNDNDISL